MTVSDAATVLQLCATFDNRTVNESTVRAWHEVLADRRPDDCMRAVKDHYRTTRQFAMPADIRNLTRIYADERAQQKVADETKALESLPRRPVHRLVETLAEAFAWTPERVEAEQRKRSALDIRCPFCGASPDMPCTNSGTRKITSPHPSRIEKAV